MLHVLGYEVRIDPISPFGCCGYSVSDEGTSGLGRDNKGLDGESKHRNAGPRASNKLCYHALGEDRIIGTNARDGEEEGVTSSKTNRVMLCLIRVRLSMPKGRASVTAASLGIIRKLMAKASKVIKTFDFNFSAMGRGEGI